MADEISELFRAFHALCRDFQPQALAHVDDRCGNHGQALTRVDTLDQGAVELDAGQRQHLERCQRGVPGAEVIQRHRNAVRAQSLQRFDGGDPGLQHRFGQFDFDAARGQLIFGQECLDAVRELAIGQLPRGDVDGHARLRPGAALPLRGGTDRRAQHPIADFDAEPGFLGHRQEFARQDQAPIGAAPADQRLDQADFQRLGADLGLEIQLELAALDGAPQALLGRELRGRDIQQV